MAIDAFIRRWAGGEGGAERANAAMYLLELTQALGLPPPDPAGATTAHNDYVFERAVRSSVAETSAAPRRIDLYKRNCFILEAKQSRWPGWAKAIQNPHDQADMFRDEPVTQASRGWDALMRNARRQAHDYVFALPADHAAPPFLIVCDVARMFEIWADFSGTGRGYAPFPDRHSYRVSLKDLARPEHQALFRAIWTDPMSLDPSRLAALVTEGIVSELAVISRALERQYAPEDVAHFLMRCIFTIFAADVGLLPKPRLLAMLEDCVLNPPSFAPLFRDLWRKLNTPEHDERFFSGFGETVPHINGGLFHEARAFPLGAAELRRLLIAARRDWRRVEPAIFGALLEQALDPVERRKLGAHYTPRAYVERLIELTIMEPLRADWLVCQTQMEQARDDGDVAAAVRIVRRFHHRLCETRVLDPACGTGNFLYVALDLMKRLEGEILETLVDLGQSETLGLETIDPRQFLGLVGACRDAWVIDLYGLDAESVRRRFPEVYEHLLATVKPDRDSNPRASYRDNWWLFGEPRADFRPILTGLSRYIATVETAKHRLFQFLDASILADNMLVCVADCDAATLAILSSRWHGVWAGARGGVLEDRPRYTKTSCFDPFPFPVLTDAHRQRLREAGEALNAHRKAVLEDHPGLTLTGLYNAVERLGDNEASKAVDPRLLPLSLAALHRSIDALTAQAYGWPEDLAADEAVAQLAQLNLERAEDEAAGRVAWLRPDVQARQGAVRATTAMDLSRRVTSDVAGGRMRFPRDRYEQPLAVAAALRQAASPQAPDDIARSFARGGARIEPCIRHLLATLHRYGHVERLADDRYLSRPITYGDASNAAASH